MHLSLFMSLVFQLIGKFLFMQGPAMLFWNERNIIRLKYVQSIKKMTFKWNLFWKGEIEEKQTYSVTVPFVEKITNSDRFFNCDFRKTRHCGIHSTWFQLDEVWPFCFAWSGVRRTSPGIYESRFKPNNRLGKILSYSLLECSWFLLLLLKPPWCSLC